MVGPPGRRVRIASGCATLRDTSSSLLLIGPDITRQATTSRTMICRALLFHSINCKPSRETGGCTHACPSRPSCDHTHTRAARQCRPTITTRSSMRITRPCVPACCAFGFFFWFSSWCACVRFFFAFRKQVIMQDAKKPHGFDSCQGHSYGKVLGST